jgi:hypothetical protein
MTEPIAGSKATFDREFLPEFYEELGRLDDSSRDEIAGLIERVIHNPYEPSLVGACFYVNEANDLFIFRLPTCRYSISWTIYNTSRNPLSIIAQDWKIKFLLAESYS